MGLGSISRWEEKEEVMALRCWPVLRESLCGSREHRDGLCHCPHHAKVLAVEIMHNLLLPPWSTWHVLGSLCCESWSSCVFASLLIYRSRLSVLSGVFVGMAVGGVSLWPRSTCWDCSLAFSLGSWRVRPRGDQPRSPVWIPTVKWHSKSLFYPHLVCCLFYSFLRKLIQF